MTSYVKTVPVQLEFTSSITDDTYRGLRRLKVECVLFGDYRVESVSDIGEMATLEDVEKEFLALEAEVAKRISNVRVGGQ